MHIRSRLFSLFLCIILLSSTLLSSLGCGAMPDADVPDALPPSADGGNDEIIRVPTHRDYPNRRTVNFDTIDHRPPDFEGSTEQFVRVISMIEKNELSYEEQLGAIRALWQGYEEVTTAYTLAEIAYRKNSADPTVAEEYERASAAYPAYAQTVEALYVACARSAHRTSFERDYFEEDISEYIDGGTLSDALVALLSEELRLENEYSALAASPLVTLDGVSDTFEGHLLTIRSRHEVGTAAYQKAYFALELAYRTQVQSPIEQIYTELVRIRRSIADECGVDSYLTYAYVALGYEYTVQEMHSLIDSIVRFVVPVWSDREFYNAYFFKMQTHASGSVSTAALINGYYDTLVKKDAKLGQIFDYMLQFGLYDVAPSTEGRFDGAFTTHLDAYDAPYLFMTQTGTSTDFLTLAHEFGHFTDFFENGASYASLDLAEVYSQGLELLSLHALTGQISSETEVYLKYSALYSALSTLVIQGYYAAFELAVYELNADAITTEALNSIAKNIASRFGFSSANSFSLFDCVVTQTALSPAYVQSYCTSTIPALSLYLMECDTAGYGFGAYKALLSRGTKDESFLSKIRAAGLASPFDGASVKEIADEIYFEFLGKHFYFSAGDNNAA